MPRIAKVYKPVVKAKEGSFSATALVGTHSVILGWNVDSSIARKKLLGFAIRRTTYAPGSSAEISRDWLRGQKRFKGVDYDYGIDVRSNVAPFQRFRWSDYTVDPDYSYVYEIFPMTGKPNDMVRKRPIVLRVRPTPCFQDGLGVYANRGVTAAHAYLRRFHGARPEEVPDGAAYRWLSRGLKESLLEFVESAKRGDELHVAIYEFHDHEVAKALKKMLDRNITVQIVFHAVNPNSKTVVESVKNLRKFKLKHAAIDRTNTKISHNKFVVFVRNGKPRAVWTGSANYTENAFYLQTNLGLVIEHEETAKAFENYFQILTGDPPKGIKKRDHKFAKDMVEDVISASQAVMKGDPWSLCFSPVRRDHVVEIAVGLVRNAKSAILMSTPFAMDRRIVEALGANDERILEYGLANTTARKKIEKLNRKNTRFFTPTRLETYMGRRWDAKAFGAHKIHAKIIVTDPWSNNPSVLIGSANFSKASCRYNDENALLAKGNKRLAAMIAVEFLRMFDHYKSRGFINQFYKETCDEVRYLSDDASWCDIYFKPRTGSHKYRDREVFVGKV